MEYSKAESDLERPLSEPSARELRESASAFENKGFSGMPRLVWSKIMDPDAQILPSQPRGRAAKKLLTYGNPALDRLESVSSLLMLQGPIGPLFSRIAQWKRLRGHRVKRVVFNAGDAAYCPDDDAIHFRGSPREWSENFREYLLSHDIDGVILFGQHRLFHSEAIRICKLMEIQVFVMEEGYVRPGFITLETGGVNGLSETLEQYELSDTDFSTDFQPSAVRWHRTKLTLHAINYYVRLKLGSYKYPGYIHHRHDSLFLYASYWIAATIFYPFARWKDKIVLSRFDTKAPHFFVPLQLDSDSQIIFHSRYLSINEFVSEIFRSFANHAPENARLIVKQHPLARGRLGQEREIMKLADDLGIGHRVTFVHYCRIHQLLGSVSGVVTINSTVGVQAIGRGVPLKIMGDAIYDDPHVADAQPLDTFWRNPFRPDPDRAKAFHRRLKVLTQVPAALYDSVSVPLSWCALLQQSFRGNQ